MEAALSTISSLDDLTPELREKLAQCKTPEDILALAKTEGIDMTDEQLDFISGGINVNWTWKGAPCPRSAEIQ